MTCDWCEATFTPYRPWQKHCCKACRVAVNNLKRARPLSDRPCKGCHKEFSPQHSGTRYCSAKCRGEAVREQGR